MQVKFSEMFIGLLSMKFKQYISDDVKKWNCKHLLLIPQFKWKHKVELKYYTGNNLHSARSFMNLVETAEKYDYYAFCY